MPTPFSLAALLISGHQIDHLLEHYGYAFVFAIAALQASGVPVPGTTALIAAAVYAGSTHHLEIAAVILAAGCGGAIGSTIGFAAGRSGGWTLLKRYGHRLRLTPERLKIGRYLFAQHGGKVVFFGRFISGLRTWSAMLAGANRMPFAWFMLFNVLGASAWALINGLKYFYFATVLTSGSLGLEVLLVIFGAGWLTASLLYLRRHGTSIRLAAESAYPGPLE